jgi:hypothetical protein
MIKRGDTAVITEGVLGKKSPNVGRVVTVGYLQGQHSRHGNVWRVHGENLVSEYGGVGGELDCPQVWLRKIEKPKEKAHEQADSLTQT